MGRYCIRCGCPAPDGFPREKKKTGWLTAGVCLCCLLLAAAMGTPLALLATVPGEARAAQGELQGPDESAPEAPGGGQGGWEGQEDPYQDGWGGYEPEAPFGDTPQGGRYDDDYGYRNQNSYLLVDVLDSRRERPEGEELPEGKEYLILTLRLTNVSWDKVSYSAGRFELATATGNLLSPRSPSWNAGSALEEGRLLPGGYVEGDLVFLVDASQARFHLYLDDPQWEGEEIRFPVV